MANENGPSFIFSVRFLIAIIAFLGYGVQYIQRVNMSTAIVCMVNHTALKEQFIITSLDKNVSLDLELENTPEITEASESICYFKEQPGKKVDAVNFFSKIIKLINLLFK